MSNFEDVPDEEVLDMQQPESPTPSRSRHYQRQTPPSSQGSSKSSRPRNFATPTSSPNKRSKVVYGDRYIPSRNGVNLQAAFSLVQDDVSPSKPRRQQQAHSTVGLDCQRTEEANKTFSTLLKAELFGNDVPSAAVPVANHAQPIHAPSSKSSEASSSQSKTPPRPSRSAPVTPNKNLFRYQSPSRTGNRDQAFTESRMLMGRTGDIADTTNDIYSLSPVRMDSQRLLLSPRKPVRSISKMPLKVLDAPDLADDFYLNLLDWGSHNVIAVGLGNTVYLWNAQTANVSKLFALPTTDKVTSVSWMKSGSHLAVGTHSGMVQIWDAEQSKRIRQMTGHDARASSLAWNEHLLSSGSRDRSILHRDVRVPDHFVQRLTGHRQEVCGLKWNAEENQLASGSNDNRVFIWEGSNNREPVHKFDHVAAVKAMAWSPHQRGLLASGGGTADRRIRFWNTITGKHLNEIDTGSQVCNLMWSKNSNEIVSTHGYSLNQVMVWKYPSMQQVAALTGHTHRVLYLSLSPDGRTVVTGAGDETLRLWEVFESNRSHIRKQESLLDAFQQLR